MKTAVAASAISIGFAAPWAPADAGAAMPSFLHHPDALRELGGTAEHRNQLFVEDDRPEVELIAPFHRWSAAHGSAPSREETLAALRQRAAALADRGFKVTIVAATDGRARLWFSEKPVRILAVDSRSIEDLARPAAEFERISRQEARARTGSTRRVSFWTESYAADAAHFVQMRQQVRKLSWTAADLRRAFHPLFAFKTGDGLAELRAAYGEDPAALAESVGRQAAVSWAEAQGLRRGERPAERAARHFAGRMGWSKEQREAFMADYARLSGENTRGAPDALALGAALLLRRWNGGAPRTDYRSVSFNRHVWVPGAADLDPDRNEAPRWSCIRRSLVGASLAVTERETFAQGLNLLPASLIVVRDEAALPWAQHLGAGAETRLYLGDPLGRPQAFDDTVARMMLGAAAAKLLR